MATRAACGSDCRAVLVGHRSEAVAPGWVSAGSQLGLSSYRTATAQALAASEQRRFARSRACASARPGAALVAGRRGAGAPR